MKSVKRTRSRQSEALEVAGSAIAEVGTRCT